MEPKQPHEIPTATLENGLKVLQRELEDLTERDRSVSKFIEEFHKITGGAFYNAKEEQQHFESRLVTLILRVKPELASRFTQDHIEAEPDHV